MAGGTLVISRAENLHSHFKKRLEELGFPNVTITALDKDGLNMLISDLKPDLVMMGAKFYECSTPYMIGKLKRKFPKIKMAVVSLERYPPDLAMYFIVNGVKSYATTYDGLEQWYEGLKRIKAGKEYISPAVQERINMRKEYPMAAKDITEREMEVIKLICCGFKEDEIAETLHISERTVDWHKKEIFRTLNVRNSTELIRAALTLGFVTLDEINFVPAWMTVSPRPEIQSNVQ